MQNSVAAVWLGSLIVRGGGWVGAILTGTGGAIVVLVLVNLIFRKK